MKRVSPIAVFVYLCVRRVRCAGAAAAEMRKLPWGVQRMSGLKVTSRENLLRGGSRGPR